MPARRVGATARTLTLAALGLVAGCALVVTAIVGLGRPDTAARELVAHAVPANAALRDATLATVRAQHAFLLTLGSHDAPTRVAAITTSQAEGRVRDTAWASYLQHALDRPGERAVQTTYATSAARSVDLAVKLLGMSTADPRYPATLAEERAGSDRGVAELSRLQSKFYDPIVRADSGAIVVGISAVREAEYVSFFASGLLFAAMALWLLGIARRDERIMIADTEAMTAAAWHADLETSLQRALEMEPTEESIYTVVGQALSIVAPDVPSEMLVADSSHAHFRQVLSTDPAADAACRVGAPGDCPATASGQPQAFANSFALDTCPYLRGREDAVWARCMPLSIAGRATGVIHVQRSVELPPPPSSARGWDLIARKAGERIGLLRAFARSETQAHTDPLTGLLNRRSFEAHIVDLDVDGPPLVVAYGDLDQFKMLNDVHGHDAGDRALRLFARVLRDNVRPNDIAARYGGEEFVVVLPDCTLERAVTVVERIRDKLRASFTDGSLPPFTVSFGLAVSQSGCTFGEVLEAADQALLRAKRTGRDRIVVSGAEGAPDEPHVVLST